MRKMRYVWPVCLLCLALLGARALSEDIEADGIRYAVAGGEAVMRGFVPGAERVVYPAEVQGYPVAYRGRYHEAEGEAVDAPAHVRTLVIGEGVTEIPLDGFSGWTSLERVEFPSTLRTIGSYAFSYCEGLTEILLPEGLEAVESWAFMGCKEVKRVSLPASLRRLEPFGAFYDMPALETVTLAEGNDTFLLADGVLYEVRRGALVAVIDQTIETLALRPGTESMPSGFLQRARGLRELTLPEGFAVLQGGTLSGGPSLHTVHLPASLTEIEDGALDKWGVLENIHVAEGNARYRSVDGVLFEGDTLLFYPPAHGVSYDVPPSTRAIAQSAFAEDAKLQTVTLPLGLTDIGDYAFSGCTALRRVSLPLTLRRIGTAVFSDCFMLEGIVLPPALEAIGEYAFANCPGLGYARIPGSVTEMGPMVFENSPEGFFIVAGSGSAGYWHAFDHGLLWAARSEDTPAIPAMPARAEPVGLVANASAEETLALYDRPSADGRALGRYANGTVAFVLEAGDTYTRVRVGGTEGFFRSDRLFGADDYRSLARIQWGRVKYVEEGYNGTAVLYASPWLDTAVGTVTEDEVFRITDTVGPFYEIETPQGSAYVLCQFINVATNAPSWGDTDACVVTSPNERDRLHLRARPSTGGESLGRFFNGTQVELIETVDADWAHVRVGGLEGYMMNRYLTVILSGGKEALLGHG